MIEERLRASLGDRYRIERELGQGGMATVYLAQDLKHDRKVAIKVLRPELAAVIGAERFVREIRTIAALQHPHILGLIDSGEAAGTAYYVMPFVEGESLRDRLNREKQLPIPDAVRIATEVAGALDYAHRHGVIHRDIKPENVLLHDGSALVADFGIALAASNAGGTRMTETGMSLGTPHYMSPEQAMGERDITARSDVYALGVLTYEMLLGEPPFTGPTAQAIVAKVLTEKPGSLVARRSRVPAYVEDAVLTALEKLPADRFASAAEFAAALGGQTAPRTAARIPAAAPPVRTRWTAVLGGALLVTAALAVWGWVRSAPVTQPLRFGRTVQLTSDVGLEFQPAISPDGRSVAYAAGTSAGTRIYMRQVAGGRAIPLTDDSTGFQQSPQWSPDGSRILFVVDDAVFSAPAAGGSARQEVPGRQGGAVVSATWSPDGQSIAFVVGDSVYLRDASSSVRPLARVAAGGRCAWSPDGTLLACSSGNPRYLEGGSSLGNLSPTRIVILRLRGGTGVTVTDSTSVNESPTWSPDGRWLYYVSTRDGIGDVYGQRISRGRATGDPIRLTTGLGAQSISLARDGSRLAYAVYTARANIWSLPLPATGPVSADRMTPVTTGNQVVENMRVSRDGRWLLFDSNRYGNADIFRVPTAGGETEQLTSDPVDEFSPSLSPDGREVAYHSWRAGSRDIYVQPLDGRPLQRVTATPDQDFNPVWAPSGTALAFGRESADPAAIFIVRRAPGGRWDVPVERASNGFAADWSPDGRYLAYTTGNDGGSLMVVPVDSGAPRVVVDAGLAGNPVAEGPYWAADSRSLFFKSHDRDGNASIWSVPAAGGRPRLLVHFDDPAHPSYRTQWALGRDRVYFPVQDRQSDVWVMDIVAARERSR